MDVNYLDIIGWVLAFFCFIVFLLALFATLDGDGMAGLVALMFAVLCVGMSLIPLRDAEHRAQDHAAQHDFAVAGYSTKYVSRLHAKLPLGDCVAKFDVRKVEGVYRPVLPGYKHGKKYWAVLTPAWQKRTTCPA